MRYQYIYSLLLILVIACNTKKSVQRPPIEGQSNSKNKPKVDTKAEIKSDGVIVVKQTDITPNVETKPDIAEEPIVKPLTNAKIAVLLPFNTQYFVTTDSVGNPKKQVPSNSNLAIEFYQGLQLAIQDNQQATIPIEFTFYDTQKNDARLSDIINKTEVSNADIIIGPVFNSGLKIINEKFKSSKTILFSPLSAGDNASIDNPNFFQFRPSFYTHALNALKYLKQNTLTEQLIIINKSTTNEMQNAQKVYEANRMLNNPFRIQQFVCNENTLTTSVDGTVFTNLLADNSIIYIASADEAFVKSIVSELQNYRNKKIQLVGNTFWQGFKFDAQLLSNLNCVITTPFFVNYKDEKTNSFKDNMVKTFSDLPSDYVFAGYDLGTYIIQYINEYRNTDFNKSAKGLSTDIDFQLIKNSNSVSRKENMKLHVLKYQNTDLVKVW